MRPRAWAISASSASTVCFCAAISPSSAVEALAQALRFVFRLRDALFDGAAFLHLRSQLAARALGIDVGIGEALAGVGELLLDFDSRRAAAASCACSFSATCSASVFSSPAARFSSMAVCAASRSSRRIFAGKHDAQARLPVRP